MKSSRWWRQTKVAQNRDDLITVYHGTAYGPLAAQEGLRPDRGSNYALDTPWGTPSNQIYVATNPQTAAQYAQRPETHSPSFAAAEYPDWIDLALASDEEFERVLEWLELDGVADEEHIEGYRQRRAALRNFLLQLPREVLGQLRLPFDPSEVYTPQQIIADYRELQRQMAIARFRVPRSKLVPDEDSIFAMLRDGTPQETADALARWIAQRLGVGEWVEDATDLRGILLDAAQCLLERGGSIEDDEELFDDGDEPGSEDDDFIDGMPREYWDAACSLAHKMTDEFYVETEDVPQADILMDRWLFVLAKAASYIDEWGRIIRQQNPQLWHDMVEASLQHGTAAYRDYVPPERIEWLPLPDDMKPDLYIQ